MHCIGGVNSVLARAYCSIVLNLKCHQFLLETFMVFVDK
jgi:hypothetical protein